MFIRRSHKRFREGWSTNFAPVSFDLRRRERNYFARWPAGSYRITEPNENANVVLIRNIAGTKGGFINFIPTTSLDSQKENAVTFQKYGDTGYLQTLPLEGETDGLEFPRTKAEAKAETMAKNTTKNTKVVEQAVLVSGK